MKSIEEIIQAYPKEERFSLAILQNVQKEYNYISSDALKAVAGHLDIPLSQVFSMATFYKALSLDKKGRVILKVCDGTACHIRGSMSVLDEIENALGIKAGETTEDGLFSLEVVNCLGSCAMAPVVICGEEYYGKMKKGEGREIVDRYRTKGEENEV